MRRVEKLLVYCWKIYWTYADEKIQFISLFIIFKMLCEGYGYGVLNFNCVVTLTLQQITSILLTNTKITKIYYSLMKYYDHKKRNVYFYSNKIYNLYNTSNLPMDKLDKPNTILSSNWLSKSLEHCRLLKHLRDFNTTKWYFLMCFFDYCSFCLQSEYCWLVYISNLTLISGHQRRPIMLDQDPHDEHVLFMSRARTCWKPTKINICRTSCPL